MQHAHIAPIDLAQAAIGPGMAIVPRFSAVRDMQGKAITVREALALIHHALDDILTAQKSAFDAETRRAPAWFEQRGFAAGDFSVADILSKAHATHVDSLIAPGMIEAERGNVRLLRPEERRSEDREASNERDTHIARRTTNPWIAVHLLHAACGSRRTRRTLPRRAPCASRTGIVASFHGEPCGMIPAGTQQGGLHWIRMML